MRKARKISLYVMAAFYIAAGINHFVNPEFYRKIMPPWLPAHDLLIYASGIAEVGLGILVLPSSTRRAAAWGIILLLLAVFPANIQMMLNYRDQQHPYLWIAVLRLPLQLLLIAWAYQFTKEQKGIGTKVISS